MLHSYGRFNKNSEKWLKSVKRKTIKYKNFHILAYKLKMIFL